MLRLVLSGLALSLAACGAAAPAADAGAKATGIAQQRQVKLVPAPMAVRYPALTGRVVDNAAILDPATEEMLTSRSAALGSATGHQFVIVTMPDLQGIDIADFSQGLGNYWGIGREGVDDGVLLVVAPKEQMARIAVGDGLLRRLPDTRSREILDRKMLPRFRDGKLQQGIVAGADAIIAAIGPEGDVK